MSKNGYNVPEGGDNVKIITPDALYTESFGIRNVFSMYQDWKCGAEFSMLSHDRPTNAFLYFSQGSAKFISARENGSLLLEVQCGALVYIPKGSRYLIRFSAEHPTKTILFEFTLSDMRGEEFVLGEKIRCFFEDAEFVKFEMQRLADIFRLPVLSPSHLLSLGYGIFHLVSSNMLSLGLSGDKFGVIEKSIRMIETSPDDDMTVDALAKISNVSVGTFNRLFREYCGMSPGAYRNTLKLRRAKKLLSESYVSVSEAAEALGFADTGYFCRWFRKNVGMTAAQYGKLHKK